MDSPLSFCTAKSSLSSTPKSSPMVTPVETPTENKPSPPPNEPPYRSARLLPYELRHHCLVYLEEQLYTSALNLLNNLVLSGSSNPIPRHAAFAPPPAHIALANTLLVHPIHTTRATSSDLWEVSSRALIFLRNTLLILGPVNASLKEAYTFKSSQRGFRSTRRSRLERESSEGSGSDDETLTSSLANENSLWTKGQDFWHVVGWAFNCSVIYPKRWAYWKLWLEHMLDVLDMDWKERERLDESRLDESRLDESRLDKKDETPKSPGLGAGASMLKDCMLLNYMTGNGNRSHAIKRVVKALFADGSNEALRAYPEVFQNETRESKQQAGSKRKRESEIDVDMDKYGDYLEDEEEVGEEVDILDTPPDSSQLTQPTPPLTDDEGKGKKRCSLESAAIGGPEAVALRLRLLTLLSRACAYSKDLIVRVEDLYDLFYDCIKPLPVPVFSIFFSGSASLQLPTFVLSSLAQFHLFRLLPHTIKLEGDDLTQDSLTRWILPYAANTSSVEDNAKVAVLSEVLLRIFLLSCPVEPDKRFKESLEKGIKEREARIVGDRRKKSTVPKSKEVERDISIMKACGTRMRIAVQVAEKKRANVL